MMSESTQMTRCKVIVALVLGVMAAPCAASATEADSSAQAAIGAPAVPGDPSGARHDYVAEVRGGFTPENRAYWHTRTALGVIEPLFGVAVALLLLFTGASARMRNLAHARARGRYGRVLHYLVFFTLVMTVVGLPLAWYSGFALEHQYQLSNQSLGAWFGEQGKDFLVTIALFGATGLVSLAYAAIESSPKRWWLVIGTGAIPVIVAMTVLQPLVIDPLYNEFIPLRDERLKAKILDLAARADIPGRNVYQVDKSKQTRKYNAYVNGFGASQRIVLWDTTLEGMTEDEILFVMGHEMGHYRLAHIWKGIAFYSLFGIALLFLCWLVVNRAIRRFGERWNVRELHDVASWPLLYATFVVVSMAALPVSHGFSRTVEREADVFALEVTRLNDAGARAFIKLGSQNRANPAPPGLLRVLLYTHPPLVERVRFCLEYRPWEEGEPNRFFRPRS